MPLSALERAELVGRLAEGKRIFSSIEDAFKKSASSCMVVTSATRGEGKTLTAAGLAILAANYSSKRVLAVDLNWFSPCLHSYFGLEQAVGIDTMTQAGNPLEFAQPTSHDLLKVLPAPKIAAGQGGTAQSQLAAKIIDQARSDYEIVIVDASSVFPANRYMIDPVALAKSADDTILVVLANVTARQEVKRAAMTLASAGATLTGVIVNQWKNPLAPQPSAKK
jgi:Mrp family chromosome partitioning ATPase